MRKFIVLICVVGGLFFAGCGGKKDKTAEKTVKTAQNQEIPVYDSQEERFFDFDDGEVENFAFSAGQVEQEGQEDVVTAENKQFVDDKWEDEDLTLALDDDKEDLECNFKVVNFDLNKNEIRADQADKVKENIKIAKKATGAGKKIVVSGHTCELGSASFNMSLSEKRAKSISDEMVKAGVEQGKIAVLGCSCEHPVVFSDASDRKQKADELSANRRTEIQIN